VKNSAESEVTRVKSFPFAQTTTTTTTKWKVRTPKRKAQVRDLPLPRTLHFQSRLKLNVESLAGSLLAVMQPLEGTDCENDESMFVSSCAEVR
jgi:hypothetical protein